MLIQKRSVLGLNTVFGDNFAFEASKLEGDGCGYALKGEDYAEEDVGMEGVEGD